MNRPTCNHDFADCLAVWYPVCRCLLSESFRSHMAQALFLYVYSLSHRMPHQGDPLKSKGNCWEHWAVETELAYPERYELAVLLSLEWYSQQSQPYLKTMVPQDLNNSTALHQGKLRVAPWFTDHQVHSLRAATLAKNLDTWGRTAKGRIAGCCHPTSIANGSLPQDPRLQKPPQICQYVCHTAEQFSPFLTHTIWYWHN